jgi:prefoldin subunit 5
VILGETAGITPVLIVLLGSGGLVGAIVAFVKLGGDRGMTAVSQAQGAMETMVELNKALDTEIARRDKRIAELTEKCDHLTDEVRQLNRMVEEAHTQYEWAEEHFGPFSWDKSNGDAED